MYWQNRKVLVTGGASFIGSHLVDALVQRGAKVRVVDDLSSGQPSHIRRHLDDGNLEFIQGDLREPGLARQLSCRSEKPSMSSRASSLADANSCWYLVSSPTGVSMTALPFSQTDLDLCPPIRQHWRLFHHPFSKVCALGGAV